MPGIRHRISGIKTRLDLDSDEPLAFLGLECLRNPVSSRSMPPSGHGIARVESQIDDHLVQLSPVYVNRRLGGESAVSMCTLAGTVSQHGAISATTPSTGDRLAGESAAG